MHFGKNLQEDTAYLVHSCAKEFDKKVPQDRREEYRQRLKQEVEVFKLKGLSSYMLIVADYVNQAKKMNIPVGPGRGSVGGSLAAYLLGIHEADPIKYGLIFERFYNKDKSGLSDIDCDFGQKGKPQIEEYIINKYGAEMCAQISNYAQLTPRPYARRIAGAYLYGGDHKAAVAIGNAIAESIPKEIHSVKQALADAPLFAEYASSEKYRHLGLLAPYIGNKNYNPSLHAGGMIIGKRPLADIVPVRITKDGVVAVEYDKDRAEENGLAKMDILGLSTLDIIQDAYNLIRQRGKYLDFLPWNYDLNDSETYKLISSGNTMCVFQLGKSSGTIYLCKKIQPRNIEEAAMINALTRPGVPKEAREEFIQAKNSGKEVSLMHPILRRSFAPTYGVAVFEECLMFLAQDVAGWDFNQADRLRKFVKDKGKDPEKGKKLEKDFVEAAIKIKSAPPKIVERIWSEIVANFASYAFNKSHAILYSFIAYQTAFLKAHFPLEFLTANLIYESNSNALDSEDNILAIKSEIRNLTVKHFDQAIGEPTRKKIKIIPPSLNQSEKTYTIVDSSTLMTGFDSLKYMGKDAIPEILEKRPFDNLNDFLSKVDGRKVRAPAVQALAAAGCLDNFGNSRQEMFLYAGDFKKKLALWQKGKKKETFDYPWPGVQEWTPGEKYAMEVYYLGEGLSGNYKEIYPGFFDSSCINFAKLAKKYPNTEENQQVLLSPQDGSLKVVLKQYFEFKVKKEESKIYGETMGKARVEDLYGNQMDLTFFPKKLKQFQKRWKELGGNKIKLEPGVALHLSASLNWYEGNLSLLFDDLKNFSPPPAKPKDLKPKQVKLKIGGRRSKKDQDLDKQEILEEIEEEMLQDGLSLESLEDIMDEETIQHFGGRDSEDFDSEEEESSKPDGFN